MGHPDRRVTRARKRAGRQKMLSRRNLFDHLDLTPYNVVGKFVKDKEFAIKYK